MNYELIKVFIKNGSYYIPCLHIYFELILASKNIKKQVTAAAPDRNPDVHWFVKHQNCFLTRN